MDGLFFHGVSAGSILFFSSKNRFFECIAVLVWERDCMKYGARKHPAGMATVSSTVLRHAIVARAPGAWGKFLIPSPEVTIFGISRQYRKSTSGLGGTYMYM